MPKKKSILDSIDDSSSISSKKLTNALNNKNEPNKGEEILRLNEEKKIGKTFYLSESNIEKIEDYIAFLAYKKKIKTNSSKFVDSLISDFFKKNSFE